MPFSAKTALIEARPHIDAARQAGNTKDIIKHYQNAKKILAKVNPKKEDAPSLKDMIDAFLELADVLKNKGPATQDKAEKCRRRADDLKKELNKINTIAATVTISLLGVSQIAVSSLSRSPCTIVPVANNSVTTSPTTSTGNVASTATFISQQQPLSAPQSTVSLSAASGSPKTPLLFSKKADRESFVCHLPAPGEQLESTRQLAYCLALLQDSVDETRLDIDTLNWRSNTLKNSEETIRMEDITRQVVREFIEVGEKNANVVEEVVQLAQVLYKETSQSLLMSFVDTVSNSKLLNLHAMEGLAKVIQEATPGSIDSNDLVTILRVLYERLQTAHGPSISHLCSLLLAVSRVLDAMVVAQVGDVDRVTLHGPLTALLHELESNLHPCVAFQAEYATQALLNISDNDNIWRAGFRRGWLVLKGAAGFAKMPDPREIKDALEGLEKLYGAGQGAVRMLNNTWEAVKTGEELTFNTKEGLKFKRIWYPTLRNAEDYIQTGDLKGFMELLTNAPCRHQLMFQLGICQLLGRFVVDAQWDLESRRSTLAFLGDLCIADDIWERQKGVAQVILDMISNLAVNHGSQFEAAKALQEVMQRQSLAPTPLSDLKSHPWYDFLSTNPTVYATPTSTLLKAVQSKKQQETQLAEISSHIRPSHSSLEKTQSALKTHYSPNLKILRISGEDLDIDTCFVNLAIVEAPAQREKEKQELKELAAVFHRIPSSEAVRGSNIESSIRLEQLFDKRKLRDGKEGIPQRILVQGRAGIGKTTLCKKIVHLHQSGLWADRFEAVLWLPLRRLRGSTCRTLESLLREKVFTTQLDREHEELARTLVIRADEGKVLFILDGLDEIATDAQNEDSSIKALLRNLLDHKQVVITSRPSGLDASLLWSIDLELETIGFSQQDVKEFISRVLKPRPARTVQDFIQRTPLIQGLVNIPVQLDVICFCWESLPQDGSQITITGLYQLMSRKLWCKDALRLKKGRGGRVLTEKQIDRMAPKEIDRLMSSESRHLGHLAFKGLRNKHQIEFDEAALLDSFEDLADTDSTDDNSPYSSEVLDMVKETSFLHSADAGLDTSKKPSQQTWSFLHLTFQEYFAATWIASKMTAAGEDGFSLLAGSMKIEPTVRFVQEQKYNPRFEIVWWMVAGLLEGRALEKFFDLLQEASSRDLIGGRHQQILASCLDEARARLAPDLTAELDGELMKWLQFEIQTNPSYGRSILGSQTAFPETLLIQSFGSVCHWKPILVRTMGVRSIFSKSAIQFLISTLKDEDSEVRNSAVLALGKLSTLSDSAIQSLIDALKDEDAYVRSSAASALGSQSTLSESAIQSLTDAALQYEDPDLMDNAAFTLGRQSTLSESAMDSLIHALRYGDTSMRYSALSALDNSSTLSIQFFSDEVGNDWVDPEVRILAASVLGQRSMLPESTIHSLIGALKDEDAGVRTSAASALLKQSMLPESATRLAIQSLIDVLKDEHAYVRTSAASVLSEQSTLPELAIQSLIGALTDDDAGVRTSAASALGKQPTLTESAIQSLIDALKDYNTGVRTSVASALGKQSTLSELAIQSLISALKDEDAYIRSSAASALGSQSTLSESAIQSLIGALKDEHQDVSRSAASALENQCHSLFIALPSLSEDEMTSVYKDHLFPYSCRRVFSLQVQHGKLHCYTEKGLVPLEYIEPDKLQLITSTLLAIQHDAKIHK